jgi:transposase
VSHANAALTPRARLRLATLIVESGWTYSAAAKMFMVSPRTAAKWAGRYRVEGSAGMADRSSRPHRSPTKTPEQLVRRIVGCGGGIGWARCRSPASSPFPPRRCTPC